VLQPNVEAFFDRITGTVSYVVYDEAGGSAVVIDPVMEYDPKAARTKTAGADRMIEFIRTKSLTLDWILETHAHADHLSAAAYLKSHLGGRTAIGRNICMVQGVFRDIFHLGSDFPTDGSQFDHLFADDEIFRFGKLQGRTLFVPGHTPADMAYLIGNAVFVGDTLFMPDVGSARCDFPGGSARTLYQSVQRLYALPDDIRMYICHDYPPPGRGPAWETSVGRQRMSNMHLRDGVTEDDFVAMRTGRDATLDMPVLILPSIQVNIRAGELPAAEGNGVRYLKIPLNTL
jgi:glyoxylase-like metal-dependent hydrolase (beta-lactamase superfamily II)